MTQELLKKNHTSRSFTPDHPLFFLYLLFTPSAEPMIPMRKVVASSSPPLPLWLDVTFANQRRRVRDFFSTGAAPFRIYIDDACALPLDWRASWAAPLQWGGRSGIHWATKYGAASFIPRMIEHSPFVTRNWREANASVVVLFARSFAGGPAIVQQQCLRRLAERSAAFRATAGRAHFFILTDDRGPCCLDGKYKDVEFMKHHIIGNHGERPQTSIRDFVFHRGWGPRLPCFDERKDIMIPTPNWHTPPTPYAPVERSFSFRAPTSNQSALSGRSRAVFVDRAIERARALCASGDASGATTTASHAATPPCLERPLLLFFAGDNTGGSRAQVAAHFRGRPDSLVIETRDGARASRGRLHHDVYLRGMRSARFCAVCDGFAPWSPRLVEAAKLGCVPVIVSDRALPPFASVLDWSLFSVRVEPSMVPSLHSRLVQLDYAALQRGLTRARGALEYRLAPYDGEGMLPLLALEMQRVLYHRQRQPGSVGLNADPAGSRIDGAARPAVTPLYNDVDPLRDYNVGWNSSVVPRGINSRSGVLAGRERWDCETYDGYFCSCTHWKAGLTEILLRLMAEAGPHAWVNDSTTRRRIWTRDPDGIRKQLCKKAKKYTRYVPPCDEAWSPRRHGSRTALSRLSRLGGCSGSAPLGGAALFASVSAAVRVPMCVHR